MAIKLIENKQTNLSCRARCLQFRKEYLFRIGIWWKMSQTFKNQNRRGHSNQNITVDTRARDRETTKKTSIAFRLKSWPIGLIALWIFAWMKTTDRNVYDFYGKRVRNILLIPFNMESMDSISHTCMEWITSIVRAFDVVKTVICATPSQRNLLERDDLYE